MESRKYNNNNNNNVINVEVKLEEFNLVMGQSLKNGDSLKVKDLSWFDRLCKWLCDAFDAVKRNWKGILIGGIIGETLKFFILKKIRTRLF